LYKSIKEVYCYLSPPHNFILPFLGQQKFGLNIIAQSWRPPLEKAFKRKIKTQGFILLNNGKQATYVSINMGKETSKWLLCTQIVT
jgi:hypothetical protein